jgi:regulatory associated protein of mTOR
MTALAVHDFAPLIATGTQRQQVRVFTNSGDPIAEVRYHDGFLGQRIGPVSCLAFHPHRLFLGVGALDSIVGVHSGMPQSDEAGGN